MTKLSALLLSILVVAAPASAQLAAGAAARSASASAATASFGAAVGAQVTRNVAAISLRSPAAALDTLDQMRAAYPTMGPVQKAAATAMFAALAGDPAAVSARLADTDLPPAAIARMAKVAASLDAAAKKNPEVAAKVAAGRTTDAALVAQAAAKPESVLPANMVETFRQFLAWGQALAEAVTAAPATPVAAPAAPVAVAEAPASAAGVAPAPDALTPNIEKSFSPNFKSLLAKRPAVAFGSASLPVVGMPQIGDTFSKLWVKAHEQSDSLLIAAYNWDDMDMAKSIVAAAKAGKKVVFVGDYSNWFPKEAKDNGGHGAQPRTPAMQYFIDNPAPNLEIYILKGLGGASGINHNKFSVFSRKDKELAQTGSFNYTKTSQLNHFENFVFTDDADRVKFLKDYHGWLVRRARPFKEGLPDVEPTFPDDDPIPVDNSRISALPFPKAVGTPKSEAGAWYVKFYEAAKKDVFGAMFAMFPTPPEVAAIEAKLAAGIPVNFIVDRGQVERAGALWGLIQKGMKLRVSAGPEQVIYKTTADANHSKLHMKYVGIDGGLASKGADSLNDSANAEKHNFENLGFWDGYVSAFLYTYVKEVMWPLASEPSAQLLQKLEAEFNHARDMAAAKGGPKPAKA